MRYSLNELERIADNNINDLIKIINSTSSFDIPTIANAISLLGEVGEDEDIIYSIIKRYINHVHVLLRESAIICASYFYKGKKLPKDIKQKLLFIRDNDPSVDLKELAKEILNDLK